MEISKFTRQARGRDRTRHHGAAAAIGHSLSTRMMLIDWVKAIHVVAVISWMAGMLYLPRLFIYHCDAQSKVRCSPKLSR